MPIVNFCITKLLTYWLQPVDDRNSWTGWALCYQYSLLDTVLIPLLRSSWFEEALDFVKYWIKSVCWSTWFIQSNISHSLISPHLCWLFGHSFLDQCHKQHFPRYIWWGLYPFHYVFICALPPCPHCWFNSSVEFKHNQSKRIWHLSSPWGSSGVRSS